MKNGIKLICTVTVGLVFWTIPAIAVTKYFQKEEDILVPYLKSDMVFVGTPAVKTHNSDPGQILDVGITCKIPYKHNRYIANILFNKIEERPVIVNGNYLLSKQAGSFGDILSKRIECSTDIISVAKAKDIDPAHLFLTISPSEYERYKQEFNRVNVYRSSIKLIEQDISEIGGNNE